MLERQPAQRADDIGGGCQLVVPHGERMTLGGVEATARLTQQRVAMAQDPFEFAQSDVVVRIERDQQLVDESRAVRSAHP